MSSAAAVRRPVERRNAPAATRRVTSRARPRLTSAPALARPRRAPFVGLIVVLLAAGSIALLGLNTALAQGAFTQTDLQRKVSVLADRQEVLQERVAELSTPRRIAKRAHALGMVMTVNPAFLRASDHAILGVAQPAAGQPIAGNSGGTDGSGWVPPVATPGESTLSPGTTSGPGAGIAAAPPARQPHPGASPSQTAHQTGGRTNTGTAGSPSSN